MPAKPGKITPSHAILVILFITWFNITCSLAAEGNLRLLTDFHPTEVLFLRTDTQQRVYTIAADHTLRIWSADTLKSLQTLTVPLHQHYDAIVDFALLEQGRHVVIAVNDAEQPETSYAMVLDTHSGDIIQQRSFKYHITGLCYSTPRNRIFFTLSGKPSLMSWQYAANADEMLPETLPADGRFCRFDAYDHLLVYFNDHSLRLFDESMQQQDSLSSGTNGIKRFSLSHDLHKLAYIKPRSNSLHIVDIDTDSLQSHTIDGIFSDLEHIDLSWSEDNRTINIIANDKTTQTTFIVSWNTTTQKYSEKLNLGKLKPNFIASTRQYPVIIITEHPSLGVVVDKKWKNLHASQRNLQNDATVDLRLSQDGSIIRLDTGLGVWQFSVLDRELIRTTTKYNLLISPITEATSLQINNWDNDYLPNLNGNILDITGRSIALSITADEQRFFIATDKELSLFDRSGGTIWKRTAQGEANAAIISKDNRFVIVSYNNQIIRWYRFHDGQELLALFVDENTGDWQAWTSEGYYDASNTQYSPVIYQLSENTRDYLHLAQLSNILYRPDLIQRVFTAADSESPAQHISKIVTEDGKPPRLSLMSQPPSKTSDNSIVLAYCIHAKSINDIGRLRFKTNDVTTGTIKNIKYTAPQSDDCPLIVKKTFYLKPGKNQLTATASNRANSILSEAVSVTITHETTSTVSAQQHFINVAKNNSANKQNILPVIKNLIKTAHTKQTQLHSLPLQELIKGEKSSGIKYINSHINHDDSVFIYLTADCSADPTTIYFDQSPKDNVETAARLEHLIDWLAMLPTQQSVIVLDCYIQQDAADTKKTIDYQTAINRFISDTGRDLLAEFLNRDLWRETTQASSLLMLLLKEAFTGEANFNEDEQLNKRELFEFIKSQIERRSFDYIGEEQLFMIHNRPDDFILLELNQDR